MPQIRQYIAVFSFSLFLALAGCTYHLSLPQTPSSTNVAISYQSSNSAIQTQSLATTRAITCPASQPTPPLLSLVFNIQDKLGPAKPSEACVTPPEVRVAEWQFWQAVVNAAAPIVAGVVGLFAASQVEKGEKSLTKLIVFGAAWAVVVLVLILINHFSMIQQPVINLTADQTAMQSVMENEFSHDQFQRTEEISRLDDILEAIRGISSIQKSSSSTNPAPVELNSVLQKIASEQSNITHTEERIENKLDSRSGFADSKAIIILEYIKSLGWLLIALAIVFCLICPLRRLIERSNRMSPT